MRPDILNPLFAETETLDGVGPKLKKPLDRLGLTRVRDLDYHLPERFVTRRAVQNVDDAGEGEQIVVREKQRRALTDEEIGNILNVTL